MKPLSILVSEDDPTGQFLVRNAISEISAEIDLSLVFSCEQLLDFLLKDNLQRELNRQLMPDLIIANYSRPFCDLKIITDIRKKEELRHIPIIVFVNEDIQHTREKFLEFGVTEVIEKPATFIGLKKEIRRVIAGLG